MAALPDTEIAAPPEAMPADVVQVNPQWSHEFGGALLLVESSNETGVRGVMFVPTERGQRKEYCRLPHGHYAIIGRAVWVEPR